MNATHILNDILDKCEHGGTVTFIPDAPKKSAVRIEEDLRELRIHTGPGTTHNDLTSAYASAAMSRRQG
jgi:hypothetical protein